MNTYVRYPFAVIAGILTVFVIVACVESLGHVVYPPPADLNLSDPAKLREYIQSLPMGAFLFVLAAWVIATFVGGLVAAKIAKMRPYLFCGIVSAFVLLATIGNFVMIPHPIWFMVVSVISILVASYGTSKAASAMSKK